MTQIIHTYLYDPHSDFEQQFPQVPLYQAAQLLKVEVPKIITINAGRMYPPAKEAVEYHCEEQAIHEIKRNLAEAESKLWVAIRMAQRRNLKIIVYADHMPDPTLRELPKDILVLEQPTLEALVDAISTQESLSLEKASKF